MFDQQKISQTQGNKEIVKVCPSVDELGWKPPTVGGRFSCPASGCTMVTSTHGGLLQHIDYMHPKLSRLGGKTVKQHQVYQFHCPEMTCVYNPDSERYFSTMEYLKAHYASQHWEKQHECQKCGKRFGLERDCRRHEAECGTVFSCESCCAVYPTRQALLVHCRRKQHPVPVYLNREKKDGTLKQKGHVDPKVPDPAKLGIPLAASVICVAGAESAKTATTTESIDAKKMQPDVTCLSPTRAGISQLHTPDSSPAKIIKGRQNSKKHTASAKKSTTSSPRPILPKGVMPSVIHVFDASGSPQTTSYVCTQTSPYQRSAQIQTDLGGVTPLYQRLAGMGVSSGCQTSVAGSSQSLIQRQVAVANIGTQASFNRSADSTQISDMATQVYRSQVNTLHAATGTTNNTSGGVHNGVKHADNSQISDMGTQVSVPLFRNIDSSQISDRGTQVSVELVNNGTQIGSRSYAGGTTVCMDNAATQASFSVANTGTQMEPPVACAAVQTAHTTLMANTATQATVFCVDNETQLFLRPNLVQPHQALCQTTRNSTNTQGTQIFISSELAEGAHTSSTGIQTSVSLLPNRGKRYRTIAQTQTSGDQILRSAMAQANLPVVEPRARSPKGASRSPGRKRSVKSSEVQTNTTVPQKRARKRRKTPPSSAVGFPTTHTSSQQTNISLADSRSMKEMFESSVRFLDEGNVLSDQNPTLASAGVDEDSSDASPDVITEFSEFLASSPPPHNSTSDMSMQVDFEDLFSSCTTDLGVQTQDDFFSTCTADFGAQTQEEYFGVCTAEFGVQTAVTEFDALLDDLERNIDYGTMVDDAVFTDLDKTGNQDVHTSNAKRNVSLVDCGIGTDVAQTYTTVSLEASSLVDTSDASSNLVSTSMSSTTYVDCAIGTDILHGFTSTASSRDLPLVDGSTGMDVLQSEIQTQTNQCLVLSTGPNFGLVDASTSPHAAVTSSTSPALTTTHMQTSQHGPLSVLDSASRTGYVDCAIGTDLLLTSSETQTSIQETPSQHLALDLQSESNPLVHAATSTVDSNTTGNVYSTGGSMSILSLVDSPSTVSNFHAHQQKKDGCWDLPCDNASSTACTDPCSSQAAININHSSTSTSTLFGNNCASTNVSINGKVLFSDVVSEVDLAAVSATDMHTQTADDLLEFLMTNMETQTTEDICATSLEFADIQTQTSDISLTPPPPSSSERSLYSHPSGDLSPYSYSSFGLVTSETQTTGQFLPSDGMDYDDLAHFADMQTQTAFDILDFSASPAPSTSSQMNTAGSTASSSTATDSQMQSAVQLPVLEFSLDSV